MKMVFLLVLCFFANSHGFSLSGTNNSRGITAFLTKAEYDEHKIQNQNEFINIRQDLIRFQTEHIKAREMTLLANKLEELLNGLTKLFNDKMSTTSRTVQVEKEERQVNCNNQAMYQLMKDVISIQYENKDLKNQYSAIRTELNEVKYENHVLKNKTVELQQKIDRLEQLQTNNQLQTLHQLDKKSKELETKMNLLENTQQASSQDFLALYSKVTSLETNEQNLESNMQGHLSVLETNMKGNLTSLEHNVNSNFTAMQQHLNTTINGLERRTSTELDAMRASNNKSLSLLDQQMVDQFKPVIFRATYLGSPSIPAGIFKFPNIETTAGIPDSTITKYKSTGKFTCHDPGYYYIIVTTETTATQPIIDIMVNSTSKFHQYMTGPANGWTPGAAAIILNLQTNDEVWIKTAGSYDFYRCSLNIFKIK